MSHKTRKFAGIIASIAVGLSLLGAGTYASFTDSATATQNLDVMAKFGITLSNPTGGAVLASDHSVTWSDGPITASAAGSKPFGYTINNASSAGPVHVVVTAALGANTPAEFSDALGTPVGGTVYDIPSGGSQVVAGAGLKWTELNSNDLGKSASITYTISATG